MLRARRKNELERTIRDNSVGPWIKAVCHSVDYCEQHGIEPCPFHGSAAYYEGDDESEMRTLRLFEVVEPALLRRVEEDPSIQPRAVRVVQEHGVLVDSDNCRSLYESIEGEYGETLTTDEAQGCILLSEEDVEKLRRILSPRYTTKDVENEPECWTLEEDDDEDEDDNHLIASMVEFSNDGGGIDIYYKSYDDNSGPGDTVDVGLTDEEEENGEDNKWQRARDEAKRIVIEWWESTGCLKPVRKACAV